MITESAKSLIPNVCNIVTNKPSKNGLIFFDYLSFLDIITGLKNEIACT